MNIHEFHRLPYRIRDNLAKRVHEKNERIIF